MKKLAMFVVLLLLAVSFVQAPAKAIGVSPIPMPPCCGSLCPC